MIHRNAGVECDETNAADEILFRMLGILILDRRLRSGSLRTNAASAAYGGFTCYRSVHRL